MADMTGNFINIREAAQRCGRNMETVRRWIWGGKLPARKLGNQLFIRKQDLVVFCRETATLKYRAESDINTLERAKILRSGLKARGYKPVNAGKLVRQMREERMNELDERLYGQDSSPVPGSKVNLIKRMKKLREHIRTRVGNLDAVAAIEHLRTEREHEITGLR